MNYRSWASFRWSIVKRLIMQLSLVCNRATSCGCGLARSTVPEADVHLSTQLPFVFATARFVHYLNAIVRDRVGAFRNSEECEDYLNAWIAGYVLSNDSASSKEQAQRPLREAHIGVSEVPGRAKTFTATISLKPHFQLEGQECVTVVNLPSVGEKRFSK